jgi:hypothetical protein
MTYKIPILTVVLSAFFLISWEIHWRSEGYPIAPDDNKNLWAENRAKITNLDEKDVIIIGSSRNYFNTRIDVWEGKTGRRPLQLSMEGICPLPFFIDIVRHTAFNGTLVVGVTPSLYFGDETMRFYKRSQNWVDHYHERTWADRFNHWLSRPLQNNLAFLMASEEPHYDHLDLRTIVENIPLPKGRIVHRPPFPEFKYIDETRNLTMWRADVDTAVAREITGFWEFVIQPHGPPPSPEETEALKKKVLELNQALVNEMKSRGGQVIFIRNPSANVMLEVEKKEAPREAYWDPLLEITSAPGYHFEDHDFMSRYTLPEWSHMATRDARVYTADLVDQLDKDGLIRK